MKVLINSSNLPSDIQSSIPQLEEQIDSSNQSSVQNSFIPGQDDNSSINESDDYSSNCQTKLRQEILLETLNQNQQLLVNQNQEVKNQMNSINLKLAQQQNNQQLIQDQIIQLNSKDQQINEYLQQIQSQTDILDQKNQEIQQLNMQMEQLQIIKQNNQSLIQDQKIQLEEIQQVLTEKDSEIEELNKAKQKIEIKTDSIISYYEQINKIQPFQKLNSCFLNLCSKSKNEINWLNVGLGHFKNIETFYLDLRLSNYIFDNLCQCQ